MMRIGMILLAALLFVGGNVSAELKKEMVTYEQGGTTLEGYLVYDDSFTELRPGVLVVHQWMGLTDYEKNRADMLAGLGYVAFALDIYGKDVRPQNRQEAGQQAGKYRGDIALFRARLNAGLEQLKKANYVDQDRLAAIGYCFGGGGVLELARAGADIDGVVSFHGSLSTPDPKDANNITARVLVCHGAIDPHVPMEDVVAFEDEMEAARVDYQLIMYAGAVHAFTQPMAGTDPSTGAAYNKNADIRSWDHMKLFFDEIFQ